MKVITIGRSHDNDVSINDPYVGRHHCQIVQYDDGSFTIVDMNSTNGTYVNGRRVFGEIRLQPNDTITIGHINLPWMSYFTPIMPPSSSSQSSMALPITLGITGGVLLLAFVSILCFWVLKSRSHKAFAFKGEYPDAVIVNMMDEEGSPYTIEAIEGQVCVWFEKGVPCEIARKSIKKTGGKIVAQIPDNGYYLVKVPTHNVQVFLDKITRDSNVDWAYPNMLSYPSMANTYILDVFYSDTTQTDTTSHGTIVKYAMEECSSHPTSKTYNIGMKNRKGVKTVKGEWQIPMPVDNSAFAFYDISSSSENGPIIINMSFGPYLRTRSDSVRYYWDEATAEEKMDYQVRYLALIRTIISNVKQLGGRDYIIVKSAGNNGVKEFDSAIISYLRKKLDSDELEILDNHLLLVSADEGARAEYYSKIAEKYKEQYEKAFRNNQKDLMIKYDSIWRKFVEYVRAINTYSNEMEAGLYDPWVTKVDISDFKYKDKERHGTSFAAPRAACILSSVANEMNLTGAEILELAREVTKRDGELTKEALLETAKNKNKDSSKEITIEGILRMYMLNSSGGDNLTYYTDAKGNVINAVGEEDLDNPYCQTIYEYRETDFDNTYLAFVVEADNAIKVTPYLEAGDDEFLDNSFQSAFMLVPQFQYNGKDFAEKYANKRVRATGTLYVPGGGWRNATEVVMKLSNLELFDKRCFSDIKKSSAGLVGTKWLKESQTTERLGVMFKSNRMVWEFLENGFVEITISYDSGAKEINRVYKYYFDGESNNWMMWNWGAVEQIGRLEGETNETVLRERAYKQGLYYTITLSGNNLIATDFSGYEKYVFTRVK